MDLTPTSVIVLGLLEFGDATPYELKTRVADTVGSFWSVPHSALYAEPERLAKAGLVAERREQGGRRRREFSITDAGRRGARGMARRARGGARGAARPRAAEGLLRRRPRADGPGAARRPPRAARPLRGDRRRSTTAAARAARSSRSRRGCATSASGSPTGRRCSRVSARSPAAVPAATSSTMSTLARSARRRTAAASAGRAGVEHERLAVGERLHHHERRQQRGGQQHDQPLRPPRQVAAAERDRAGRLDREADHRQRADRDPDVALHRCTARPTSTAAVAATTGMPGRRDRDQHGGDQRRRDGGHARGAVARARSTPARGRRRGTARRARAPSGRGCCRPPARPRASRASSPRTAAASSRAAA